MSNTITFSTDDFRTIMLHSKRASGYYFHLSRFWDWCIALTSCLQTKKLHSEALREHCQKCLVHEGDLIMALDSEQQRGLKWTGVLKCTYCTYMSKFHNFYRVTERSKSKQGLSIAASQNKGCRSHTANTGLRISFSKCQIGCENFYSFCMSAHIPPQSTSGMLKAEKCVQTISNGKPVWI